MLPSAFAFQCTNADVPADAAPSVFFLFLSLCVCVCVYIYRMCVCVCVLRLQS